MKCFSFLLVCLSVLVFAGHSSYAQDAEKRLLQGAMKATDGVTLKYQNYVIDLWGVDLAGGLNALDQERARLDLDNAAAAGDVKCYPQSQSGQRIEAQCFNALGQDLSDFMLKQGHAIVDRANVLGSRAEQAYLNAEQAAMQSGLGAWRSEQADDRISELRSDFKLMSILNFVFFVLLAGGLGLLGFAMVYGFQRAQDVQDQTAQLLIKHNKLKEKERDIVAVMLHAELTVNLSKIEAYLVIYEELLRSLRDPSQDHKYKKSGEVVQKAPALDRFIFDGNVDKLDILGERLAADVVEFYTHARPEPGYSNLEPDMDGDQAIAVVNQVVENAQNLQKSVEELLEMFEESGFKSANLLFST